jgi:hypothetical protein
MVLAANITTYFQGRYKHENKISRQVQALKHSLEAGTEIKTFRDGCGHKNEFLTPLRK